MASKPWKVGQRVKCPQHFNRAGKVVELSPPMKRPWAWVVFDDAPNERISVWLADLTRTASQRQSSASEKGKER